MRTDHPTSQPIIISGTFEDFEDFTDRTAGWDNDIRQLRGGVLRAELCQVLDHEVSIGRAYCSQPCYHAGVAPVGFRTFAILDGDAPPTHYCGEEWNLEQMVVLGKYNGFESTSPAGFFIRTVSISDAYLERWAELSGSTGILKSIPEGSAVLNGSAQLIHQLRCRLRSFDGMSHNEAATCNPAALKMKRAGIAHGVLDILTASGELAWNNGRLAQHSLLARVKDAINENLGEAVKVQDVARELSITT